METIHEPLGQSAGAASPDTDSSPATELPTTWPKEPPPDQRTVGQRGLIFLLFAGAIVLDGYELLTLVTDLAVVAGTILRFIAIPFQVFYFVSFTYLCWQEKIPRAERQVINAIRIFLTFLGGFELFANFIPVIGGLLSALPLKTITVVILFYLRPLAERLLAKVPLVGEVIHAVEKSDRSQGV